MESELLIKNITLKESLELFDIENVRHYNHNGDSTANILLRHSENEDPKYIINVALMKIKNIGTIEYNGKSFGVRTFVVEHSEIDGQTEYTVACETLLDEMLSNTGLDESIDFDTDNTTLEQAIDNRIYHYVEEGYITATPEIICQECLDIPMTFISES